MKNELNSRQWALYNYLKSMGDTWTTQYGVAFSLSRLDGYYTDFDNADTFHDSAARMQMTADIRAINESSIIQKIIITSSKGIKLANSEEFDRYIRKEIMAAVRKLMRAKHKAAKGNLDGQMRLVFNSERDTVKAFLDSDKVIGERLRAARLERGLTANEVVLQMNTKGFDAPMLSKIEKGYCLPNKTTLARLCAIYAISPEIIMAMDLSGEVNTSENNGLQGVIGG